MKVAKCFLSIILALFLVTSSAMATKTVIVQDVDADVGATFWDALGYVNSGALVTDTLELVTSGGVYGLKDTLTLIVPIVIVAQDGLAEKPVIQPTADLTYRSDSIIDLQEDLTLNGIIFDGHHMGTTQLDSIRRIFRTYGTETGPNYEPDFKLYNCDFRNVYQDGPESTEGKLIEFAKGASAGVVVAENCTFTNFGDEVFNAGNGHKNVGESAVTPAHGGSFSELTIKNCTFNNVDGSCIKANADIDSLTVDGIVTLENLTFNFCQRRVIWTRDFLGETVRNIIIANTKLGHETFGGAEELIHVEMFGSTISNIDTFNIVGVKSDGDTVWIAAQPFIAKGGTNSGAIRSATLDETTIYGLDPMFADAANGDFRLYCNSPVIALGHDGEALGDKTEPCQPAEAVDDKVAVVRNFRLYQNYPNPFNPTTTIKFALKEPGLTTLKVYDILGHEVATLVNKKMDSGYYEVILNNPLMASGVYIYQIKSGNFVSVKKMILMK